jgi:hypothetical protein
VDAEVGKELEATVAARRELGPDHDEHLIAGFLDRIDKEIDRRVDERVSRRGHGPTPFRPQMLGAAVPIVAVAGIFGGPAGVFVALAALALVFVVLSVSRR